MPFPSGLKDRHELFQRCDLTFRHTLVDKVVDDRRVLAVGFAFLELPELFAHLEDVTVSVQALLGRDTILTPLRTGQWQKIVRLALAALICGFFWEMWNFHSLAKWIYAVPFVNEYHLFEMPLLGYAGYLPFGLECAVVGEMVREFVARDSVKEEAREDGAPAAHSKENVICMR